MALQKILFETNKPVEVALAFTDGRECESNYGGKQVMFTTIDERVMFLSPVVADKLRNLNPLKGEPIEITKAEVHYGNGRKGIEWQVKRVGNPPEEVAQQASSTSPAARSGQSQPRVETAEPNNGHQSNGNGSNKPPEPPASESPLEHSGFAGYLRDQANCLIDVYASCLSYASTKYGNSIKPEDVRALVTSAYIAVTKGGSR